MTFEKSIERCKRYIDEYSKGINQNDIDWIKKRITEANPQWDKFEEKNQKEYYVLDELYQYLSKIQRDKPPDIRAYVEKEMKKQEYDQILRNFMSKTGSLNLGDEKKCDEIEKELDNFMKKADKDIPGFSEARARVISELHADIMAVRTDGKRGSARMLMKLVGQRIAKENKEKKGN